MPDSYMQPYGCSFRESSDASGSSAKAYVVRWAKPVRTRRRGPQLCPDGLSNEKNSWDGSSDPERPFGVSRVIGWLKSTADGSLTCAQSVTMDRVVNFQVPLRFSYLSR